jgi:hypothetical protein
MRANTPKRSNRNPGAAWLLLCGVCAVTAVAQQELANLKSRADAAQGIERINLSLEVSHQELEYANKLYTDGEVEKAEVAIGDTMIYINRATEAAIKSNKRLKQTEIDLRKLQHRMHDIGMSLNVDDRPAVDKDVVEIEQLRANLLAKMFGDKAEPKEKSQ